MHNTVSSLLIESGYNEMTAYIQVSILYYLSFQW